MHRFTISLALVAGCSQVDDPLQPPPSTPLPGVTAGQLVERGAVAAIAPAPGEEVFAEALLETGEHAALHLRTELDGTVSEIIEYPEQHGDDEPAQLAAPGCGTQAHSFTGYRWTSTYDWHFNSATTPSGLSVDAVIGALRRSTSNITDARNTCGLDDRVGFTARYQGTRATPANIIATGGCATRDGVNITGFGDLRPGVLALTCTWSGGGIARESDARINKDDFRWYVDRPAGCSGRFGIEAVMTHERGHTAGLGHSQGTAQTMFPSIAPCDDSTATLGSGDVAGLRKLY